MTGPAQIGLLSQTACVWEATARKVGNVHRYRDFADMNYLDFVLSAAAIGDAMTRACHAPLGTTILSAIEARAKVCSTNTNLGIVLLLAPLASVPLGEDLRQGVRRVLAETTVADSVAAFEAIRMAKPGGLGKAPEQDVAERPTLPFTQIMALAADRDLIAKEYATDYADLFEFGVPTFVTAFEEFGRIEQAIIECQIRWLARSPDTLVVRKFGSATAEHVQQMAQNVVQLGGMSTGEGRVAGVAFDRHLRTEGSHINPGTSADLITATLFIALRENRVSPLSPFVWDSFGWLG